MEKIGRSIPVTRPYKLPFESNKWGYLRPFLNDILPATTINDNIALRLNGDFSIYAMFKQNNFINGFPGYVIKGNPATANGYLIYIAAGNFLHFKRNGAEFTSTKKFLDAVINTVTITYNSGTTLISWYINGIFSNSTNIVYPANNGVNLLNIGNGDHMPDINLYELAIFNKELTLSENLKLHEGRLDPLTIGNCLVWIDSRLGHLLDLSNNGNNVVLRNANLQ